MRFVIKMSYRAALTDLRCPSIIYIGETIPIVIELS